MDTLTFLETAVPAGTILMSVIGLVIGLILLASARRWPEDTGEFLFKVNQLLPQTQCAQCGYPGCKPYAEAILTGEAINKCPPGGDETITALASLLGREAEALDASCGVHKPALVALIREDECIGCTLCIQACPVDAIIGAPQLMHSVIAAECTGCELCLAPCPVDCIDLAFLGEGREEGREEGQAGNQTESQTPLTTDLLALETACIHCGLCADVCPKDLAPQQLLLFKDTASVTDPVIEPMMETLGLAECIECKLCDRVCPANIDLTGYFKHAKHTIKQQQKELVKSQYLQSRYQQRQNRLIESTTTIRKRPTRADTVALLANLQDGD